MASSSGAGGGDGLQWGGWMFKKAFKTLTKQSWKRRWCRFNPDALTISWHASAEDSKSLGEFEIDPLLVLAQACTEHGRDNELKIESRGQSFYGCTDTPEERTKLLQKIDAARRTKITGDDGAALVKSDKATVNSGSDPGRKVFTWGVGNLLGNGNQMAQAWALPQVVQTMKYPFSPAEVCAGPEHAACVDTNGGVHLWGSNEFQQAGVAGSAVVFKPVALSSLGARKVLSIACGGSHTLAVVADAMDAGGGAVVGWGTGTVGQLGLGQSQLLSNEPLVIPIPELHGGHSVPVRTVAAGLVTSAAVAVTGEVFVWGDASLGRLGLPDIADTLSPAGAPVLVNGKVVWTPTELTFEGVDLGKAFAGGARASVSAVGLGGSFSLFLLHAGEGAGGVLVQCGAIGVDITKDKYGYPEEGAAAALDDVLDREIRGVARFLRPRTVPPFDNRPTVLHISAGARHAAVVAEDSARGGHPRVFVCGKGWLGTGADADSVLLGKPSIVTSFAAVGGKLADEDVTAVACGHSHTVAVTSDGRLFCWGRGDSGELGQGNLTDRSMPHPVRPAERHHWAQAAAGSYYTAAIAEPGDGRRKAPHEIADSVAAVRKAVHREEEEHRAKYLGGEVAAAEEATEGAAAALPDGWDYEYDGDGNIYFIKPDGSTTWDDPRG